MPTRDAIVIPGTICPVNIVGRLDMMMLPMRVDETVLLSGKL
jgi:hypothetical protein